MAARFCHSIWGATVVMIGSAESAELFGGCGGLGLGLARAGFRSRVFVEWNGDAVSTVRFNAEREVTHIRDWHVVHSDVREIRWDNLRDRLALVSGGPPCQPFGIGGLKKGATDARDMWPEAIRAVRETRPSAFLFENVRNLAGPRFRPYLQWIEQRLRHAEETEHCADKTPEHELIRLQSLPPSYQTTVSVVNAADFGAPQVRYRVLVAGIRAELRTAPGHPMPTHSMNALLWDQWVTGDYWKHHGMRMPRDQAIPSHLLAAVSKLRLSKHKPLERAWLTVRDAVADLGEPNGQNNHLFQHGARIYAGHTGSPLDWPSKALKAGDHGVPGGENMMVKDDGTVRYFSVREAARLQGMPDDWAFVSAWGECMRQLGNAVPTQLAQALGEWMAATLRSSPKS